MAPSFNFEHAPTLDEINTLRESAEKDKKAMERYKTLRKKFNTLFLLAVFMILPISGMIAITLSYEVATEISRIVLNLMDFINKLLFSFAFFLFSLGFSFRLFINAPKPTCNHHYSVGDLTATSDEHREQNSHLIINDNLDIQRYVNAVKAQGRPLYKFELKHFSEILTPTL